MVRQKKSFAAQEFPRWKLVALIDYAIDYGRFAFSSDVPHICRKVGKLVLIHEEYMAIALAQAEEARSVDEVPVGAVIVREGIILAAAHNQREQLRDPTAHAEMIAITQAATALDSWRLEGCSLYVTLEPCLMCAGAILQARVSQVVFGAADPKAGAVCSLYQLLDDERMNHKTEAIGGVMSEQCGKLLTGFFAEKRRIGKK